MDAERTARFVPHLSDRRDSAAQFVERRAHGGVEALSRVGEVNTPRGSTHECDAESLLEPPHRLTDSRVRNSQPIASGAEPLRLGDCNERRHAIEFVCHWQENLTGLDTVGK